MLRLMQEQLKIHNQGPTSGIQKNRAGHTKYCYSHGLCNHTSKKCRNKKEGHNDDATLKNRMGGSSLAVMDDVGAYLLHNVSFEDAVGEKLMGLQLGVVEVFCLF